MSRRNLPPLPSVREIIALGRQSIARRRQRVRLGHTSIFNPVVRSGADPWVVKHKDSYYYCRHLLDGTIIVRRVHDLNNLGKGRYHRAWEPPSGSASHNIWAPELHFLDERWYIYFAADKGRSSSHRMYVLESAGSDPEGSYTLKAQLAAKTDRWAIDGTVLTMPSGERYFIWSGWAGRRNRGQNLYIARLKNPWTITGDRVLISRPVHPWEGRVNEGPEVLWHKGQASVIYSANGSWTDDYCLGQLRLTGQDPMAPGAWIKQKEPIFKRSKTVFGPGHASFVPSLNGSKHWIIYHAEQARHSGWKREIHINEFEWDDKGNPHFGEPV